MAEAVTTRSSRGRYSPHDSLASPAGQPVSSLAERLLPRLSRMPESFRSSSAGEPQVQVMVRVEPLHGTREQLG